MKLQFEERPYAGKTFRPRPEIHLDEGARLLIVATPWGARAAAKKVIERITEYMTLALEDNEATSPFERLSCLSPQANNLRIATLLANEAVYREDNVSEYRSGVEIFAAVIDDNEIVWLQAGSPHILLGRPGRKLLPLGSTIDLSFDLWDSAGGDAALPPLPSQLLGLDTSLNLNLNSFRAHPGDRVVLLSYSHVPEVMFSMQDNKESNEITVDKISRKLAAAQPDGAFWLGILSIDENQGAES